MRTVLIFCCIFAVTLAKDIRVISNENIMENDGRYHYHYELDDGSRATQSGYLKHVDHNHEGEAMEGKFSFVADDGKTYTITYTADEEGYRAVGAHLPTPPPVPESVIKALKYIEEHPYHPPAGQKY